MMTIKEASRITGVSTDNLRYYERIGLIPPVPRTASGIRDYDESSIRWVAFILKFKKAGMPLETITEYCRLVMEGEATRTARKQLLEEVREELQKRIEELQSCLDLTAYKIEHYDTLCGPVSEEVVQAWKHQKEN